MKLPPRGTPRILMVATLVNTFGNGAYLTTSALFLTRSVGLTPAQVAVGLMIAAVAGMALTTPMGYLVDRRGPRGVQVAALVALAGAFAAMTTVKTLWSFALLACVIAVGDATVKAANGAMIAGAVPAQERVRTRAFVRSTNNLGIALGTLAGSIPLALDSRSGYLAVLLLNTVTFLGAALIVSRADRVAPATPPPSGPRIVALRDKPFVAFAMVDGLVAALYNELLSLALPLWLVAYTHGPVTLVSAALLVNTIGCVTLQVWASRGTHTAADATGVTRRGALVVAASCVLFGLTSGGSPWLVGVLVLMGAAVHVLGELWLSSATFAVVFDLAPDWAQGQYQGVHQTGRQIGNMAAPPLLTALVIGWGAPGWAGLAAIFAAAGFLSPHIIRWCLRRKYALAA
ncbi:MFS transporter [Dactylosporangium sp. NPDC048998]|uniref:MFS transporter n=1 Tax=Dactylosporangium sp. NPDC048998 TaxID=3363976 RepID=UPI0037217154